MKLKANKMVKNIKNINLKQLEYPGEAVLTYVRNNNKNFQGCYEGS